MNNSSLSYRLAFLSSISLKYKRTEFYDFCCDHGQLGLSIQGSFETIFLVDQVKSITNKLHSYIPSGNIEIVLEDCTKIKLPKQKQKTVAIAGIGGMLSIRILENIAEFIGNDDIIILSPHNNLEEVRDYLKNSSYGLEEECLITDNNKFYEILALSKCSEAIPRVGRFESSESSVRKAYFTKAFEYFSIKAAHNKDSKYTDLECLYKSRLEELKGLNQ